MKTLIITLLFATALQQANAQTAAVWNLNDGPAATSTAAGIATGGITVGDAFLQFVMVPASGYYLALDSVTLTIPKNNTHNSIHWSLRSSLDGYTSDLTTGTLSNSDQETITVALPSTFRMVDRAVRFRVYGSDQEISSISVAGSAITGTIAAR